MFAYRGGLYNLFEEPNEKGSWVTVWTSSEKSFILLSVYEIWLSGTGRGTEDGTLRRQVTGKLVHFALVLYIDWQAVHLLTDTQASHPPSIPQTHTAPWENPGRVSLQILSCLRKQTLLVTHTN